MNFKKIKFPRYHSRDLDKEIIMQCLTSCPNCRFLCCGCKNHKSSSKFDTDLHSNSYVAFARVDDCINEGSLLIKTATKYAQTDKAKNKFREDTADKITDKSSSSITDKPLKQNIFGTETKQSGQEKSSNFKQKPTNNNSSNRDKQITTPTSKQDEIATVNEKKNNSQLQLQADSIQEEPVEINKIQLPAVMKSYFKIGNNFVEIKLNEGVHDKTTTRKSTECDDLLMFVKKNKDNSKSNTPTSNIKENNPQDTASQKPAVQITDANNGSMKSSLCLPNDEADQIHKDFNGLRRRAKEMKNDIESQARNDTSSIPNSKPAKTEKSSPCSEDKIKKENLGKITSVNLNKNENSTRKQALQASVLEKERSDEVKPALKVKETNNTSENVKPGKQILVDNKNSSIEHKNTNSKNENRYSKTRKASHAPKVNEFDEPMKMKSTDETLREACTILKLTHCDYATLQDAISDTTSEIVHIPSTEEVEVNSKSRKNKEKKAIKETENEISNSGEQCPKVAFSEEKTKNWQKKKRAKA